MCDRQVVITDFVNTAIDRVNVLTSFCYFMPTSFVSLLEPIKMGRKNMCTEFEYFLKTSVFKF